MRIEGQLPPSLFLNSYVQFDANVTSFLDVLLPSIAFAAA